VRAGTLYNALPLIVKNPNLTALPPRVVYLHDTSSIVPILFLSDNPALWARGDILGYFVLAGHGIGFTNSQADVDEFNNFMNSQPFTCVTTSGTNGCRDTREDQGGSRDFFRLWRWRHDPESYPHAHAQSLQCDPKLTLTRQDSLLPQQRILGLRNRCLSALES